MRNPPANSAVWYDFYEDWELIEASIAQQYGIRIRKEIDTISWEEVKVLIGGLLPETPLGKIIGIRSENDSNNLKNFTSDMKRIRREWRSKQAKEKEKNPENLDIVFQNMANTLKVLFYDN